jgi:hypothetical protein
MTELCLWLTNLLFVPGAFSKWYDVLKSIYDVSARIVGFTQPTCAVANFSGDHGTSAAFLDQRHPLYPLHAWHHHFLTEFKAMTEWEPGPYPSVLSRDMRARQVENDPTRPQPKASQVGWYDDYFVPRIRLCPNL